MSVVTTSRAPQKDNPMASAMRKVRAVRLHATDHDTSATINAARIPDGCGGPADDCGPCCGVLSGVVSDATTGFTISGATVTIDGTSLSVGTDFVGLYSFNCVPAGLQTVRANTTGYNEAFTTANIDADAPAEANLALSPITADCDVLIVLSWGQECQQ